MKGGVKEGDINAGMSCEPEVESGVGGNRGDWGLHVHHATRIRISDVEFVENRSLRGQDNSNFKISTTISSNKMIEIRSSNSNFRLSFFFNL